MADRPAHSGIYIVAVFSFLTGLFFTTCLAKSAHASFKTLYNFCSVNSNCPDGGRSNGGLLIDSGGNLYGTAKVGGANNKGAVYELSPSAKKTYSETVLYSFCPAGGNCVDGAFPLSKPIMDASGDIFGSTVNGGANNDGTVFELIPDGSGGYTEQVLYSFCQTGGNLCTDGQGPFAGVVMDSSGDLFGTASTGGAFQVSGTGAGVVFELVPNQSKTSYTYNVIYNFCSQSGCADGITPYGGLLIDSNGDLFGTAAGAGFNLGGTAYELIPNQTKTAYTEATLYQFCQSGGNLCTDGQEPGVFAPLIEDGAGNLYGVTEDGGANRGGIAFELSPSSGGYVESVLYDFCAKGGSKCTDGSKPGFGVFMDSKGNLYGTTGAGGKRNEGIAFKLSKKKKSTVYTEKVLHSFCTQGKSGTCTDGINPDSPLVADSAGKFLYGTTNIGGAGIVDDGTVFRVSE